jgi:hypothetical protein
VRKTIATGVRTSLVIGLVLVFSSLSFAQADTANPPVITGVTIDTTKIYKPGDEYVIEVKYRGGLPSLRKASLLLYTTYQPNNAAYECLGGAPDISSFSYNFPFTPKYTLSDPGVVKFYGQILSSCVEGANYFVGLAKIEDSTLLLSPSFSVEFTLRVSGGLRIPPGTIRPTRRDPSPPLLSFDSPVYVSTQSTYELPTKNLEGITLNWFVDTPLICDLEKEHPFQLGGRLKFLTEGQCILNAQANISQGRDTGGENSSFNELRFIKKFQVYRDKAAADAKAIADKAAADAIRKAAADANRKEQIISVSPLSTGSVRISSIGLPIQVKSTSNLPVFAYNSTDNVCVFENGIIRTKISGRCVIGFSQEGNSEFKPASNLILDFIITSANTKTTITCIKGKLTKKVTAVKPKCPAGYKVKK